MKRKALTPAAYMAKMGLPIPKKPNAYPYHWHAPSVGIILDRREYTGCTVNFKTYANSMWDKKRRQEIRIEYDLVGFIPINELLKAVQAA